MKISDKILKRLIMSNMETYNDKDWALQYANILIRVKQKRNESLPLIAEKFLEKIIEAENKKGFVKDDFEIWN